MTALDIDDETDDLLLLENAIVVPPGPDGRSKWQPSGVLTSGGEFVENSISWSSTTAPINAAPKMPAADTVIPLAGTHMFGGISYGHFGHFITESMTRVWALDELKGKLDGLIFTPKIQMKDNHRPFEVYDDLVRGMGIDLPITSAKEPMQVERLYVPKQGFGLGDLMAGSRKYRDYIRKHAGKNVIADGDEKIYISRSKLPRDRGGLVGEWKLEAYLADEGYRIFHPQLETKRDQLAQYKKARQIIAVDCSPLHLVGYVGDSDQSVGILTRRSMTFGHQFVTQLSSFHGIGCHIIDAIVNDWLPVNTGRPSRSSFGEVSYADMYRQLKKAGMITGDTPWTDLTVEERNADLHRVETLYDLAFRPLREDASFVSSHATQEERA